MRHGCHGKWSADEAAHSSAHGCRAAADCGTSARRIRSGSTDCDANSSSSAGCGSNSSGSTDCGFNNAAGPIATPSGGAAGFGPPTSQGRRRRPAPAQGGAAQPAVLGRVVNGTASQYGGAQVGTTVISSASQWGVIVGPTLPHPATRQLACWSTFIEVDHGGSPQSKMACQEILQAPPQDGSDPNQATGGILNGACGYGLLPPPTRFPFWAATCKGGAISERDLQ